MNNKNTIIVILDKLLEVEYTTSSQLTKLTGLEKMDLYKYFRKFKKMGIETGFKKDNGYFVKNENEAKIIVIDLKIRRAVAKKDLTVNLDNITEIMENGNGMELEFKQALKLIKTKLNIKDWYGEERAKVCYWEWRRIWKTRRIYY